MSIPKLTKDLAVIQKLSDLPNSLDGLTAAALKAKFDEASLEIQRWANEQFIPALIAANIPFESTSELNAQTLQEAVEEVFEQVKGAAGAQIVNGSVTKEKLASALFERVYGGRPFMGLDTPAADEDPAADFPVGQIWLRPSFLAENLAAENWVVTGGSVSTGENKITVTGDKTLNTTSVTQSAYGLGNGGDRVYILFSVKDKDLEIETLTLSVNGEERELNLSGVYEANLTAGGGLQVSLTAQWPSITLADGSFSVENFTVVNADAILRQNPGARDMHDWGGYLKNLLPISEYHSPFALFIQTEAGNWTPFGFDVLSAAKGELLYGTGTDVIGSVPAAEEENSVLQFSDGKPAWQSPEQAALSMGVLRCTTGSYTGNGQHGRSITLPVTPKLLYVYCEEKATAYGLNDNYWDNPSVLADGARRTERCYTSTSDSVTCTIRLSQNVLTFEGTESGGAILHNREDVGYHWTAIY